MKHIDSLALVRPTGCLRQSVSLRSALILLAACALLSSCSSPGSASSDPMRNAMGFGMQGQMAAHQQASLARAGAGPARSMRLAPMQVPAFPAFQPFAQ